MIQKVILRLTWVFIVGIIAYMGWLTYQDFYFLANPSKAVMRSPVVVYGVFNKKSKVFEVSEIWKGANDPRLSLSVGQQMKNPLPADATCDGVIVLFSPPLFFEKRPKNSLTSSRIIGVNHGMVHGRTLNQFKSDCGL